MNYLSVIASEALNEGTIGVSYGFFGAVIHNCFDTRYATPLVTGTVSILISRVSAVAVNRFFEYAFPQVSMAKLTTSLLSLYIGSLAATQMGFPIEMEQCFMQHLSAGVSVGVIAACLKARVEAVERLRNAFLRAREAYQ